MTYEYAALELSGVTPDGPIFRIIYRKRYSDDVWSLDGDYGPIYTDFAAQNVATMLNEGA